jgi:hypothetical protein
MLIKSIADFRTVYPRLSKNYTWENLSAFVEDAERTYIVPYIGQAFYDELDALVFGSATAIQQEAIKRLRMSIANYTLLDAFSELSLQMGDAGIAVGTSQNTTGIPQWKEHNIKAKYMDKAEKHLDLSLEYLELKASDFTTWKDSDEYTVSKELFINTATQLSEWVPLFNSRRAYISLRQFIKTVERDVIKPTISKELFDALKVKVKENALNDAEKELLTFIQQPLSNLAARKAFNQIAIAYNGRGFRILSDNDSMIQKLAVPTEKLQPLFTDFVNAADISLTALKRYLQDNADTFPLYKASASYVEDSDPQPQSMPDNTGRKSFLA